MSWVTDRIAVGGGIWTDQNMIKVTAAGVTHIIDMQMEFDDTDLAEPYGVEVLWNPVDDDFQEKSPDVFQRGVEFAMRAFEMPGSRVLIHCAAGIHRAPMMALALLRVMGWTLQEAKAMMQAKRNVVDFAEVYVRSVENFVASFEYSQGKR